MSRVLVFAGDLPPADVMDLIDRWCSRAQRSRIPDFVKAAATIRKNKDGICAAIERQLSNDQVSHCTSSCCFGRWYGMCLVSCA